MTRILTRWTIFSNATKDKVIIKFLHLHNDFEVWGQEIFSPLNISSFAQFYNYIITWP